MFCRIIYSCNDSYIALPHRVPVVHIISRLVCITNKSQKTNAMVIRMTIIQECGQACCR